MPTFPRPIASRAAACLLTALLAGFLPPASSRAETPAGQAGARTEPLTIVSSNGRHAFDVEVMRNDADRARGLMFRRTMAPDHGMLFDFERSEAVNMWMKNTILPLDMVFIRTDGTVARIAADAEPYSTRVISSGEPVLAVLELNAGTAARLGIHPGDRVEQAMFKGH